MAAENHSGISRGRYEGYSCDRYIGTKEALIAAGLARAEWFPVSRPMIDRRGKKRTFEIVSDLSRQCERGPTALIGGGGWRHVQLQALQNGRWELNIPLSNEAIARREAARMARHKEKATTDEEKFQRALHALPPVSSGSLSDTELHHIRVLRGLNDRRWSTVLDLAEGLLVCEGNDGDVTPPKVARLQLVVDNDRPA